MENKQNPHYKFSPLVAVATIILNFLFIVKWFEQKKSLPFDAGPSVGYYILFFAGMILTLFLTVRVYMDLFRFAGDHPWYMKYLVIYLSLFSLAYVGGLIGILM